MIAVLFFDKEIVSSDISILYNLFNHLNRRKKNQPDLKTNEKYEFIALSFAIEKFKLTIYNISYVPFGIKNWHVAIE